MWLWESQLFEHDVLARKNGDQTFCSCYRCTVLFQKSQNYMLSFCQLHFSPVLPCVGIRAWMNMAFSFRSVKIRFHSSLDAKSKTHSKRCCYIIKEAFPTSSSVDSKCDSPSTAMSDRNQWLGINTQAQWKQQPQFAFTPSAHLDGNHHILYYSNSCFPFVPEIPFSSESESKIHQSDKARQLNGLQLPIVTKDGQEQNPLGGEWSGEVMKVDGTHYVSGDYKDFHESCCQWKEQSRIRTAPIMTRFS